MQNKWSLQYLIHFCKDHLLNKSVCTKIKSHRLRYSPFYFEIEFTFPLVCTFLFLLVLYARKCMNKRKWHNWYKIWKWIENLYLTKIKGPYTHLIFCKDPLYC